jgi:hypothetical protein
MSDILSRRHAIQAGGGAIGLGLFASALSAQEPTTKTTPELQEILAAIEAKGPNKFVVLGPYQVVVPKGSQLDILSLSDGAKPPGANLCVVVAVNQNNVKGAFQALKEDGTLMNMDKQIPSNRPLALWCCGALLGQHETSYTATYHILVPPS